MGDMVAYLDSGTVSSDYVVWRYEEEKIRAFLHTTNRGMDGWLREQWEAAEEQANTIFSPEHDDEGLAAEIYQDQIGVWPADYFWQLSAAVLKDAVALYEGFLERLAAQVLRGADHRLSTLETEDSWRWPECRAFYAHYVGVDAVPPQVQAVFWIRNKLTHLRGELRTGEGRDELQSHIAALGLDAPANVEEAQLGLIEHPPYLADGIVLSQLQTWRLLDVIAQNVGTVALAAFPYLYRGRTNSLLDSLRNGSPVAVDGLTAKQIHRLFTR